MTAGIVAPRAPLEVRRDAVAPAHLDYNGHMNDAAFAQVFSLAVDDFFALCGLGDDTRAALGRTIYTLCVMIHYQREAKGGDQLVVHAQILEHDEKRIRLWLEMRRADAGVVEEEPLAVSEQLIASVDQSGASPRIAAFPPGVPEKIEAFARDHATLPVDPRAGQGVALKRRRA